VIVVFQLRGVFDDEAMIESGMPVVDTGQLSVIDEGWNGAGRVMLFFSTHSRFT
jgi:hypothetical protein